LNIPDVVYIGSIHPEHLKLCKLALSNGKHVLCEKPLCVNTRETKEVIQDARVHKRFYMEVRSVQDGVFKSLWYYNVELLIIR